VEAAAVVVVDASSVEVAGISNTVMAATIKAATVVAAAAAVAAASSTTGPRVAIRAAVALAAGLLLLWENR